jgi:hypothetical protein
MTFGSTLKLARLSFMSEELSPPLIAALSFTTIVPGVPAGAMIPVQNVSSKSG